MAFCARSQSARAADDVPPRRIDLRWTRGEGAERCPSEPEIRAAVAERLGHDPFEPSGLPRRPGAWLVEAEISRRDDEALHAKVALFDETGSRVGLRDLDSAAVDCEALGRATVLMLVMATEESGAAHPPAKESPPPAPQPPPALPEEGAPPVETGARTVEIDVGLGGAVGLTPSPGPTFGAGARLRFGDHVYASLRGLWAPAEATPERTFSVGVAAAGPGICFEWPGARSRLALGACFHLAAGSLWVTQPSVPVSGTGAHFWMAGLLGARGRLDLAKPLYAAVELDAAVPFTRDTFVTQICPPTGFQQAALAPVGIFSVGVAF
jgi:hypothetical protein